MLLSLASLLLVQSALTLPPGPAAAAWGAVEAGVAPAELTPWPAWPRPATGPDPWDREEPWRRWVELERGERRAHAAPRRGELALLALEQGRFDDAWEHATACAQAPEVLAALLPRFLPGIPRELVPGPAGAVLRLAPGVRLSPALPPPLPPDVPPSEREMRLAELFVGETRLSMRVALEPDGVQVDLVHLAGPTAEVQVVLPTPPRARIGAVYVDWARQEDEAEDAPAVVTVLVTADEPEHAVWGRFRYRPEPWPRGVPDALPVGLRHGFEVVVDPSLGRGLGRALRFGEALSELLEVPAGFREPEDPPRTAPPEPLTIQLLRASELDRKLAALVGRAERFALP